MLETYWFSSRKVASLIAAYLNFLLGFSCLKKLLTAFTDEKNIQLTLALNSNGKNVIFISDCASTFLIKR